MKDGTIIKFTYTTTVGHFFGEATARFETPDRSVGINGGWFLETWTMPGLTTLGRDQFEQMFGYDELTFADDEAFTQGEEHASLMEAEYHHIQEEV